MHESLSAWASARPQLQEQYQVRAEYTINELHGIETAQDHGTAKLTHWSLWCELSERVQETYLSNAPYFFRHCFRHPESKTAAVHKGHISEVATEHSTPKA